MRISDGSSDVCSSDLQAHQAVAHLHHVGSTVRLNPRAIFMRSIKIKRNQERTATTETNDLRPRDSTVSGNAPSARTHWPIDRKSKRLTPVTNAHLVCRLLLAKKKHPTQRPNSKTLQ